MDILSRSPNKERPAVTFGQIFETFEKDLEIVGLVLSSCQLRDQAGYALDILEAKLFDGV